MYEETLPNAAIAKVFLANLVAVGRPMRTRAQAQGQGLHRFRQRQPRRCPPSSASLRIADETVAGHSKEIADAAISRVRPPHDAGRRQGPWP